MKSNNSSSPDDIGMLTPESLGRYWDETLGAHGPTRTIGVDMTSPFGGSPSINTSSLMVFLPLYLGASFLKCQNCNSCCKPNLRKWDKGVVLNMDEVKTLGKHAQITKRKGQYILKYPCSSLSDKKCTIYSIRPSGCRLFPFSLKQEKKAGRFGHGIIMSCPAGKELYIKTQLYLKELTAYMEDRHHTGIRRFGIEELETIKRRFEYSEICIDDMAYMKNIA